MSLPGPATAGLGREGQWGDRWRGRGLEAAGGDWQPLKPISSCGVRDGQEGGRSGHPGAIPGAGRTEGGDRGGAGAGKAGFGEGGTNGTQGSRGAGRAAGGGSLRTGLWRTWGAGYLQWRPGILGGGVGGRWL